MADARPTTPNHEQAAADAHRPRPGEREADCCHPPASAPRPGRRSETSPDLGFAESWGRMMAAMPGCAEAFLSEGADDLGDCCGPAVDNGRPSASSDPTEAAAHGRGPQATPGGDQPGS